VIDAMDGKGLLEITTHQCDRCVRVDITDSGRLELHFTLLPEMDFHLDSLLNLANVTVFTSSQKEEFILLKLDLLNEGINCPHCQNYTDIIHQNRTNSNWTISIISVQKKLTTGNFQQNSASS
jgi:hypothetical protein